jgi:hypothetical protein
MADDFEQGLLLAGPTAEALAWLRTNDGVRRTLGELASTDEAIDLVEGFYRAGAVKVSAVKVARYSRETLYEDEVHENTGHLVVELPEESKRRKAVFRLQGREARRQGYDPTADTGQRLLYVKLD